MSTLEFIQSNFNDAVALRILLKRKSISYDNLIHSFIDKTQLPLRGAKNVIDEAIASGFISFDEETKSCTLTKYFN